MFRFFILLFIFCHANVDINWNVKQCSYSSGKPYKQCNDLLGCQCLHEKTVNTTTCTQCIDGCTLIGLKDECNANMHCEFNSQCERIDLFSQTVRFYHIEVAKEDWDFINSEEQWEVEPYVPCNFTLNYQQDNEKTFEYAMVKVKGSVGSKVVCETEMGGTNQIGCRSLSYQINIDKNLPDDFDGEEPEIGGKDKIQFHAMMNDNSLMIERLSYTIMHHYLNITTSRAVHCVLFVNGEKLGVFLNTEELDEKSIGPILFGEKGTMYKDAWPSDLGPMDIMRTPLEDLDLMEKLIGESLQCVSKDKLKMSCSTEQGKAMLKKYIDTDSYTKTMLANNLLNNFDGTPKSIHNHYWFQNENKDPYVFVPWDYNNLIMSRFCKVNKDTGMIEGFGEIQRYNAFYFGDLLNGVCDAPPFQYLPSTSEERQLVCACVSSFTDMMPGAFNRHMACNSAFGIVASQSLVDDYFRIRDDVFKGNEIKVKNEVDSMLEHWSNQIRPHIDTSSLKYPSKEIWEERIIEIPSFFDYGLDQLMHRKKELKRKDIDAHLEWIKSRAEELGKCDGGTIVGCLSNSDCEYEDCTIEDMTLRMCSPEDQKCYAGSATAEECLGKMEYTPLEDGTFCFQSMRVKMCPPKRGNDDGKDDCSPYKVNTCKEMVDCDYAGCKETEELELSVCSPLDSKCYLGTATAEECVGEMGFKPLLDGWFCFQGMKYKECPGAPNPECPTNAPTAPPTKKTSTAESRNCLSKMFGIATILILFSFIL